MPGDLSSRQMVREDPSHVERGDNASEAQDLCQVWVPIWRFLAFFPESYESIHAMAGLLTCTLRGQPSRPVGTVAWRGSSSPARKGRRCSQQRELFRICTGFPFHPAGRVALGNHEQSKDTGRAGDGQASEAVSNKEKEPALRFVRQASPVQDGSEGGGVSASGRSIFCAKVHYFLQRNTLKKEIPKYSHYSKNKIFPPAKPGIRPFNLWGVAYRSTKK